jgi:hypothetical protein
MRVRLLLLAVLAAAVSTGAALGAARPVRPSDAAVLARAPTYEEQVAEAVAGRLTRKTVTVRCGPLGVAGAGWPNGIAGITLFTGDRPAGYAILLPQVCAQLVAFRRDPSGYDPASCGDSACFLSVEEAAMALGTVTHESYHLLGFRTESKVECYGMQSIWYAATKLGASARLGEAIARFYATTLYPSRRVQTPAYWSPECRNGGKLDLRPNDPNWPS